MKLHKPVIMVLCMFAVLLTATAAVARLDDAIYRGRVKDFKAAIKSKDYSDAAHQAELVAEDDSTRAVEVLLSETLKSKNGQLFKAVAGVLAGMKNAGALMTMICVFKGSKWEEQIIVAQAFGLRDGEPSLNTLMDALKLKREEVLRVVLESLLKRRCPAMVEPLIKFLEEHEPSGGRLCGDARNILRRITGQRYGTAASYRAWWEKNGGKDFVKPKKIKSKERFTTASFFGVEVDSKRCVFIIDVSGSMRITDPLPPPDDGKEEGEGDSPETGKGLIDKDKDDDDDDEGYAPVDPSASRVRIERAKAELIKVVQSIKKDAKFTIIIFSGPGGGMKKGDDQQKRNEMARRPLSPGYNPTKNGTVQFWKKRLVAASDSNKKSAVEFVKDFQAFGATFTDDVLKEAFKIKEADTFYFLTDGMPDKRAYRRDGITTPSTEEILKLVADLNAIRHVRINTFGFIDRGRRAGMRRIPRGPSGSDFAEFLKKLAKENGGKFREIR
ncbi:MAG: hypothetical protein E3J72_14820 [Planctomycetota bacterium]|nr:MAG: hypothetical protein E3J72_14820 [Planctomycetota bacterium]